MSSSANQIQGPSYDYTDQNNERNIDRCNFPCFYKAVELTVILKLDTTFMPLKDTDAIANIADTDQTAFL